MTRRVATLNTFVLKSTNKCLPFFKILRKNKAFEWTEESEVAFQLMKEYLGLPPLLVVLKVQNLVYYVSKVLIGAKTRYLKIKKIAYALLIAAKNLIHYFKAHPIVVLIDQPLKQFLQRPDTSGQLLKWSIKLSEFHISY